MAGFTIPLSVLAAKMNASLETVVRKSTFELFGAVLRRTPVDTGRLRANWNVSAGAPNLATTASTSSALSQAEIAKVLGPTIPVGGVVYLSNGLPYAHRIEYEGWSSRAPAGMVRVSALEFSDHVKRIAGTL